MNLNVLLNMFYGKKIIRNSSADESQYTAEHVLQQKTSYVIPVLMRFWEIITRHLLIWNVS